MIKSITQSYSRNKNFKRISNANPKISNNFKSRYPKILLKQSNKSLFNKYQNKLSCSNGLFRSEISDSKINNNINN